MSQWWFPFSWGTSAIFGSPSLFLVPLLAHTADLLPLISTGTQPGRRGTFLPRPPPLMWYHRFPALCMRSSWCIKANPEWARWFLWELLTVQSIRDSSCIFNPAAMCLAGLHYRWHLTSDLFFVQRQVDERSGGSSPDHGIWAQETEHVFLYVCG